MWNVEVCVSLSIDFVTITICLKYWLYMSVVNFNHMRTFQRFW